MNPTHILKLKRKPPLETLAVEVLEEMASQSPEAKASHVLMDSNQLVVVQYPPANSSPEVPLVIGSGNGNYHHHSNPVESHTNMEVEEKTAQILLEMASQTEIKREVEVKPKVSQNVGSYPNTTKFKVKMKFPSIKAVADMKKVAKQAMTPFAIFPDVQTLMDVRTVMNLSVDDEINSLPEEEFSSFLAKVQQIKIQWSCNFCNSLELPDISSGFINCRDCQRLYHVSCSYQVGQYSDYTARQYDEYYNSSDLFGKKYYSNFTCGCQKDEPTAEQHDKALEEGNRIIASFESPIVDQEPLEESRIEIQEIVYPEQTLGQFCQVEDETVEARYSSMATPMASPMATPMATPVATTKSRTHGLKRPAAMENSYGNSCGNFCDISYGNNYGNSCGKCYGSSYGNSYVNS